MQDFWYDKVEVSIFLCARGVTQHRAPAEP